MQVPVACLAEALREGYIEADSQWNITSINSFAARLFRRSQTDLVGISLWELFPLHGALDVREHLIQACRTDSSVEFDFFYPTLYSWHEIKAVPVPGGIFLLLRDITNRQWMLQQEAERAYLQRLFKHVPAAVTLTSSQFHHLEFLNDFARNLVGGRHLEGVRVSDAFPEFANQGLIELMDEVFRSGKTYSESERNVRLDILGDGKVVERYFTFVFQAVREFDTQISGVLTIAYDVTEHVRDRLRLEKIAEGQSEVMAKLPEGVIVTDPQGRIIHVNEFAAELHGRSELNVSPDDYTSTYNLLTPTGEPYPVAELPLTRAVLHNETVKDAIWKIRQPSGDIVEVEGSAVPVFDRQGAKIGAVLTIRRARGIG